ncbi:MAG: hypothetical protein JSV72_02415, partial [Ralstonia sp.]
MRWLVATASRLMPVTFLVVAIVAVAQFWSQHGPSGSALGRSLHELGDFLGAHAWWIAGGAACFWFLT